MAFVRFYGTEVAMYPRSAFHLRSGTEPRLSSLCPAFLHDGPSRPSRECAFNLVLEITSESRNNPAPRAGAAMQTGPVAQLARAHP